MTRPASATTTLELLDRYRLLGEEEFAREWPWPVLVRKTDKVEFVSRKPSSFHTSASESVAAAEATLNRARSDGFRDDTDFEQLQPDDVIPIRKRAGSTTFAERIGIGRAVNMDVRIELPRISKYHAYVTFEDGELRLCDARSTFGTFLDGVTLEPLVAATVQDGSRVEFGPYAFRMYSPIGLRAHLASLARL